MALLLRVRPWLGLAVNIGPLKNLEISKKCEILVVLRCFFPVWKGHGVAATSNRSRTMSPQHRLLAEWSCWSFYRYFLRSGPWAWWAKLAYQVMLTIRGRLITPFVLGSMSVGLNILIRHSFMDLWFWITALVPWPQLLIVNILYL